MDSKDILAEKRQILEKLAKRQLNDVFKHLIKLVVDTQNWTLSEKLTELETNFRFMLNYQFESTVEDTQRDVIYNKTVAELYELTDDITHELLITSSPNIFYQKLRTQALQAPFELSQHQRELQQVQESILLIDLLEEGEKKTSEQRRFAVQRERLASTLFDAIFTSPRATAQSLEAYTAFVNDPGIALREKCLFVSALTLNLFHRFDYRKACLLLDLCVADQPAIRQRAIVGLIIVLQMYDMRWKLYPQCQYQIQSLYEDQSFKNNVSTIIKQLIGSRQTEAISKKLTHEIIPEMMKLNSLAGKKLNIQDLISEADFADKNPDWKKELENSGLVSKLQEYSNLQMQGADVFHSTFANLKNFSFFSELGNWFLPFELSYSELMPLSSTASDTQNLLQTAVVSSGQMCNSDKYSFCLSLLQIPQNQRQIMMIRFNQEADQLKEMQKDMEAINPKISDELIANQYIQDLYRFYKLHPHKNNFYDIFNLRLNFYEKDSIRPFISDRQSMSQIANFCFEKNFFAEAQAIYQELVDADSNNADLWQRLGYCKQMRNDLQGALDCYLQAELLSYDNPWVIKRIAQLYRSLKDPSHAIEYYQRALQLNPDNLNLELSIGHCYLELGQYQKALNSYFKVEMLDGNSTKAWRAIAWTAFLVRKFDLAQQYYQQILTDKPTAHDYLNAAHVELCLNHRKEALELYAMAVDKVGSFDKFMELLEDDKKELLAAGIQAEFIWLLVDALKYKAQQPNP